MACHWTPRVCWMAKSTKRLNEVKVTWKVTGNFAGNFLRVPRPGLLTMLICWQKKRGIKTYFLFVWKGASNERSLVWPKKVCVVWMPQKPAKKVQIKGLLGQNFHLRKIPAGSQIKQIKKRENVVLTLPGPAVCLPQPFKPHVQWCVCKHLLGGAESHGSFTSRCTHSSVVSPRI